MFKQYLLNEDNRVWRYIRYKADREGISLSEAANRSLSRLWRFSQRDDVHIAIITAFRNEYLLPQNLARNVQLSQDIRAAGLAYVPVAGGFVEKSRETGEDVVVEESSFFVSANTARYSVTQFRDLLLGWVTKYDQDAALMKPAGDPMAYLIESNGQQTAIGQWSLNNLSSYYTRLKKGPQNRQFTFEAAGDASLMTQYAVDVHLRS